MYVFMKNVIMYKAEICVQKEWREVERFQEHIMSTMGVKRQQVLLYQKSVKERNGNSRQKKKRVKMQKQNG